MWTHADVTHPEIKVGPSTAVNDALVLRIFKVNPKDN